MRSAIIRIKHIFSEQ